MRRLLLGMVIAATAMLLPAVTQADDHKIAEFIKSRLQVEQQRGNLRGFNVDMRVDRGTVWFKGHVSNEDQERLILSTAQQAGYLGVVQVVDDIEVKAVAMPMPQQQVPMPANQNMGQTQLRPASYQEPAAMMQQRPRTQLPMATGNVYNSGAPLPFAQAASSRNGAVPAIQAGSQGAPMGTGAPMGQPGPGAPMAQPAMGGPTPMAMGGNMVSGNPNMPGYAWPGYAAHPNYGALSYPKQYSPSAWPYIGPFYPYPQVPLGWRRVELEWDDGWWFLDFHDR